MRHLVTGGAGFLGAALCAQLLRDGDEPIVFDLNPTNVLAHIVGEGVARRIAVRGDVTDGLQLLRIAEERKVDTIIHLVGLLGPAANRDPGAAVRVNGGGFVNALETARTLGLRKVVWASSWAVFRGYREGDTVGADAPYTPVNIYGATKILGELVARQYATAWGVESAGIRFVQMTGLGREHRVAERAVAGTHASPTTELWAGLSTELIDKPLAGKPGRVPYGDDVADWLWVSDGARALALAARAKLPGARLYNISGDVRPVRDAVAEMKRLVPGADVTALPGKHCLQATIDTHALREDLGFEIEWRMEAQLHALVEQARALTPARA